MKRVLVVGSNSYIGRKFYDYVQLMKEKTIMVDLVGATHGAWRLTDFSQYDVIIHLAAIVHKKETKDSEELYNKINHKLAVEVAKKAKEKQVKQFIFMSTAAVYGGYSGCITKDTIPKPTTFYGKSKLAAEQDIIKLQDKDFNVALVRPPMIYGEGCKGNYKRLVQLAKFMPFFPDYHNKRSMLHIDGLSEFLVKLIKREESGCFHPQDKEYVDTCELVVRIRGEMGKRTYLIGGFRTIICALVKHIEIINKLFGDLYYERNLV